MKNNKMGFIILLLGLTLVVVPSSINLNNRNSENNDDQLESQPDAFDEDGIDLPTDDIAQPDQENEPSDDLPQKTQINPEEEINKKTKPSIIATMDIKPNTLCLKSRGRWIYVFIELPAGYDIYNINTSSILLNETILAENSSVKYGDYDEDGIPDLKIKFYRSELIEFLQDYDEEHAELSISGNLTDNRLFIGSDTIKLVHFLN